MQILITSGGTKIPIDSVRSITNMSKGTFGSKIAQAALEREHCVTFLRAKDSASPLHINFDICQHGFYGIDKLLLEAAGKFRLATECEHEYSETPFTTFDDYAEALERHITKRKPEVVILAAAVSDYGTDTIIGKARSRSGEMNIPLKPLPKLINKIKQWHPDTFLVGFKLLVDSSVDELVAAAKKSINDNGCDLVVANDLRDIRAGNHKIMFVSKNSIFSFEAKESENPNYLAQKLIEKIEEETKK